MGRAVKQMRNGGRVGVRAAQVGAEMAGTMALLGETAVAAQQTIAIRLTRLAGTLLNPATITDPEFTLMGREKLEAATKAGFALAEGWRVVQDGWWDWGAKQMKVAETAGLAVMSVRTPVDLANVQIRFAEESLDAAETACSRMVVAASKLAGLGLNPIHRTASANAKRLMAESKLPALLG